jgi:LacI family transcriptional regulator
VVINRFSLAGSFDVVGWDHRAEGKTVANYLIERGHRRLAFIALPPPHRNSTQNRLKGYGEACQASGVDLDPGRVELIEADHQLAPAISRVIDRGADAIFVPGQERGGILALGFIQRSLKLRIPEDISLIGGENPGWSALFDPPLTTVDAPFGLLAQRSVDHMLSLIDHSPTKSTEVFIGTNIIERKSVMIRPQKS